MTLDLSDFTKMGTIHRSGAFKKSNDTIRLVITTLTGMIFGYFIGISFPSVSLNKINLHSSIVSSLDVALNNDHSRSISNHIPETRVSTDKAPPKIYVPTNPRGAESLPPAIVVSQSDFYLRRLWGEPSEIGTAGLAACGFNWLIIVVILWRTFCNFQDLTMKPKYLVTFTVGLDQRNNIDAAIKKFSEDFQIMLFHYDGWTSEWDQFEWSKKAIHVSVRKQTKWWYAKRFLHPDIIAAYEYIFIWDEDLGVEHFNGDKNTEEKPGWCGDPHLPPCAAFVEIMAPVFSREAWRCVWHMIQNDLVHGWGLDFALRRCVEPAHEKIGVVDSQWVVHQVIPSLGNQLYLKEEMNRPGIVGLEWGTIDQAIAMWLERPFDEMEIRKAIFDCERDKTPDPDGFSMAIFQDCWEVMKGDLGQSENGKSPWQGVRDRCRSEWAQFQDRIADADKAYLAQIVKG
ncbi:hypothetical protein HYC85_025263 [Camellia sinensis]|uniref:Uncharacterized protein n=1 Tax=Camellia sinensis TaxID=4442 RepID=A0A7J7GAZ7_CAMSI|nr:hypothetical protein HYC85_025263 [Camellia sinensis]